MSTSREDIEKRKLALEEKRRKLEAIKNKNAAQEEDIIKKAKEITAKVAPEEAQPDKKNTAQEDDSSKEKTNSEFEIKPLKFFYSRKPVIKEKGVDKEI